MTLEEEYKRTRESFLSWGSRFVNLQTCKDIFQDAYLFCVERGRVDIRREASYMLRRKSFRDKRYTYSNFSNFELTDDTTPIHHLIVKEQDELGARLLAEAKDFTKVWAEYGDGMAGWVSIARETKTHPETLKTKVKWDINNLRLLTNERFFYDKETGTRCYQKRLLRK